MNVPSHFCATGGERKEPSSQYSAVASSSLNRSRGRRSTTARPAPSARMSRTPAISAPQAASSNRSGVSSRVGRGSRRSDSATASSSARQASGRGISHSSRARSATCQARRPSTGVVSMDWKSSPVSDRVPAISNSFHTWWAHRCGGRCPPYPLAGPQRPAPALRILRQEW